MVIELLKLSIIDMTQIQLLLFLPTHADQKGFQMNGARLTATGSWVLDHPYCAKLLAVKVKQEEELLIDRINTEVGCVPRQSDNSNSTFQLPSMTAPLENGVVQPIASHIAATCLINLKEMPKTKDEKHNSSITTAQKLPGVDEMVNVKIETAEINVEESQQLEMAQHMKDDNTTNIFHVNNPPSTPPLTSSAAATPLTSSAATSRTSSPTNSSSIPRRMSMRKKKETQVFSSYKRGIKI